MSDQVYVQDQPGLVESLFPTLVYWAFVGRQTNIQTEIDALYPYNLVESMVISSHSLAVRVY